MNVSDILEIIGMNDYLDPRPKNVN